MKNNLSVFLCAAVGLILFANVASAADTTPPRLNFIEPYNGVQVSGYETFMPSCTDDSGVVAKVELYIDDRLYDSKTLTADLQGNMFTNLNTSKLANGNHTFYYKVYDAAGNLTTSPTNAITAYNTPPVVNITSMVNGATESGVIHITAKATSSSYIGNIKILLDGTNTLFNKICEKQWKYIMCDEDPGFCKKEVFINCNLDSGTLTNGAHKIIALAEDETYVKAYSSEVSFTASNTPGIFKFTSPVNGATVHGIVPVSTYASQATYTELYLDGVNIVAWKNCATCSLASWNSTKAINGWHTFKARAIWGGAYHETSTTVNVSNDSNTDITPPTVVVTNPKGGAWPRIETPQTMVVTASVSDNVGVAKVEFYIEGVLKGIDTTAPYSYNLAISDADNGTVDIFVKAYDAAGNSNRLDTDSGRTMRVNIRPNDTFSPSVFITDPITDTIYTAAQTVVFDVAYRDNVAWSFAKAEFYIDGVLKGTATAYPYRYSWPITAADNGTHILVAKAYDKTGNVGTSGYVTVTVNVGSSGDTVMPTVSLTAPASGSSYTSAQTVAIKATASDNVGVAKVEFYDGSTKLGTGDTTSPYEYAWAITAANNGTHSLTAKAYDAAGNIGTSAAVNVTVNIVTADTQSPAVSISAPSNNTSYTGAQTVNIGATASDNVGVTKVEFYDGSVKLGTEDNSSPYEYAWPITDANNGAHSLTAKAYDAAGNSKVSAAVNVTVNIPASSDTTPPAVSITSPTNNSSYTAAQTVNIGATATDNVGVSKVVFYDGSAILGTDTASPYSYSWAIASANNGSHSLTAKAYDAVGNVKTSATINVTVNITVVSTAPTVSIITPANGSNVSGTVAIGVTTTNKSLTSQYTALYIDGKYVSSAIPRYASFTYNWNTASYSNGPHTIKATIGTAASTSITVTVNN